MSDAKTASDRLAALAQGHKKAAASQKAVAPPRSRPRKAAVKGLTVNPERGERGDFYKVSATIQPELFELLSAEVQARKVAKERGANSSVVIREALIEYFERRKG